MTNRIYAWDKRNGQVVYRIPGHTHGDGQADTEDHPVWLLGSEDDVVDISSLPQVSVDDA